MRFAEGEDRSVISLKKKKKRASNGGGRIM